METKNIPEDIAAEKAVLSAILLEKDSIKNVLNILNVDDFYREAHKVIFKAMLSLFFHDKPIDIVTLTNYLRSRRKLDLVGGVGYITSLNTVSAANIIYHADIVKNKAIFRRIINAGKMIQELGYSSSDSNSKEAVDKAQHLIMQLSNFDYNDAVKEISLTDLFKSCLNRIITSNYKGINTGIDALDLLTNGLHARVVTTLQGKTGCGKTALALQMMIHMAEICKVIYITDKHIDEVTLRLVCALASVSCWKFKTNKMQDNEWQKIQEAITAAKNSNMGLYSFNSSVIELVSRIREIYSKQKMQVLFLDLQLENEMLQKIQNLAEELNIVILLIIDCKEDMNVGNLNMVLKTKKSKYKLIIDRNDGGPTGTINLNFDKDLLLFTEMA